MYCISTTKGIFKEQTGFYQELFSAKGSSALDHSRYCQYLSNLPKLSETQKETLESEIEFQEIDFIITKSKDNKGPGPDGFTNDISKIFFMEIGHGIHIKLYLILQRQGNSQIMIILQIIHNPYKTKYIHSLYKTEQVYNHNSRIIQILILLNNLIILHLSFEINF